jgi:hypothetical protein
MQPPQAMFSTARVTVCEAGGMEAAFAAPPKAGEVAAARTVQQALLPAEAVLLVE